MPPESKLTSSQLLANLNQQQRAAAETIYGPVLVIAGPGTGKTQTLAVRIAHLLEKTDVKPRNILSLTFTEAGVRALKLRLRRLIGDDAHNLAVHTYHSFCNEVIQGFKERFPEFLGNPRQLDDLNRLKILRELIDAMPADETWHLKPFGNPYQYIGEVTSAIQTLKREGLVPDAFAELAEGQLKVLSAEPKLNRKGEPTADYQRQVKFAERSVELADLYKKYQAKMLEEGFYDYDDMILKVVEKMKEDVDLRGELQERHQFILVDEYQDTNGAQNELILQLAAGVEQPNLFVVGDDDQAIYRFQGANVGNILYFRQNFPEAKILTITDNYRSSGKILKLAENSISHNKLRLNTLIPDIDKTLSAKGYFANATGTPQLIIHANGDQEHKYIAEQIKDLNSKGVKFSEIAILYRKHADAEPIVDSLLTSGVPVHVVAGANALEANSVIMLLELVRLFALNPDLRHNLLAKVLLHPYWDVDEVEIFKFLRNHADRKYYAREGESLPELWDVLLDAEHNPEIPDGLKKIGNRLLEYWQDAAEFPIAEWLATAIADSGLGKYVVDNYSIEEINALHSFFAYVKSLNQTNPAMKLADLLADLDLLKENKLRVSEQQLDTDRDAVNLMTAHAAKGLEFRYVFMPHAHDRSWSGRGQRKIIKLDLSSAGQLQEGTREQLLDTGVDLDLEDERRLFFVALTRAQEQLTITYAQKYIDAGVESEVSPSTLVLELDQSLLESRTEVATDGIGTALLEPVLKKIAPPNINEAEFLETLVKDFSLSASALNEFLECPLKFKFNRLYKIPDVPSKYVVLGNSTHFALEQWARRAQKNEPTSLDDVLADFYRALNRELINDTDRKSVGAEGKEYLTGYFQQYEQDFPSPAEVEYNFRRHHVMLNADGQEPISLNGKLDKVLWTNEESGEVKVVDYKTSAPKSENAIKGLTKSHSEGNIWRQLVFYKLLADLDPDFRPAGKSTKYKVTAGEVDFLRPEAGKYRRVLIPIADSDVAELKTLVANVMAAIRRLEFHGSDEFPLCDDCEYCNR